MFLAPYRPVCYSKSVKRTAATKWLTSYDEHRNATSVLVKVSGVVFLCFKTLSDKRKYECQQCKDEHSKGHEILKIKRFLVHQHHPHSMQNRGQPPCNTVVLVDILPQTVTIRQPYVFFLCNFLNHRHLMNFLCHSTRYAIVQT